MPVDVCLSVCQLARYWRIRPATVRQLIRSGQIVAFRGPGKRGDLRVSPAEIARYEESRTVKPAKAFTRRMQASTVWY